MNALNDLASGARFRERLRGYDYDEVDDFVKAVGQAASQAQELIAELQQRVNYLEARQTDDSAFSEDRDTLVRTLVLAQRTADSTVAEAQSQAEAITETARERAMRAVAEAEAEASASMRAAAEEAARVRAVAEEGAARLLAEAEESSQLILAETKRTAAAEMAAERQRAREELRVLEEARNELNAVVSSLRRQMAAERAQLRGLSESFRSFVEGLETRPDPAETADGPVGPPSVSMIDPEPEPHVPAEAETNPEPEVQALDEPDPEPQTWAHEPTDPEFQALDEPEPEPQTWAHEPTDPEVQALDEPEPEPGAHLLAEDGHEATDTADEQPDDPAQETLAMELEDLLLGPTPDFLTDSEDLSAVLQAGGQPDRVPDVPLVGWNEQDDRLGSEEDDGGPPAEAADDPEATARPAGDSMASGNGSYRSESEIPGTATAPPLPVGPAMAPTGGDTAELFDVDAEDDDEFIEQLRSVVSSDAPLPDTDTAMAAFFDHDENADRGGGGFGRSSRLSPRS